MILNDSPSSDLSKHLDSFSEIMIIVHNLPPQTASVPLRLTFKWVLFLMKRSMQDLLSWHSYLCKSFLPAFNNLVPSDCELEGFVPVSRGVKLLSILQGACHKQSQHQIMVKNKDFQIYAHLFHQELKYRNEVFKIKVTKVIVVLFRILVVFQFPKWTNGMWLVRHLTCFSGLFL